MEKERWETCQCQRQRLSYNSCRLCKASLIIHFQYFQRGMDLISVASLDNMTLCGAPPGLVCVPLSNSVQPNSYILLTDRNLFFLSSSTSLFVFFFVSPMTTPSSSAASFDFLYSSGVDGSSSLISFSISF